jgi:hypothetical protein
MDSVSQKYESLRRALSLASKEPSEHVAQSILENVVLDTIKQYQERVKIGLEDSVSDLLDTFKQKLIDSVFEIASEWQLVNKEREPCVFPKNCRFAYQKGTSSIFVIEQEPQVRSIMLGEGLSKQNKWVALAMPYVIFFIHFRCGFYSGLHVAWAKKPLSNMDDQLYLPILSNIHKNSYQVCTGFETMDGWSNKSMGEVSQEVVGNFWHSTFNKDLVDNLILGLRESGIGTFNKWFHKTQQDPLFILKMRFIPGKSFRKVIDLLTCSEETLDESEIRKRVAEKVNEASSLLFHRIWRYFKKKKFEAEYPKSLVKFSRKAIEGAMDEYTQLLMTIEQEMLKIKEELQDQQPVFTKGKFWEEYRS